MDTGAMTTREVWTLARRYCRQMLSRDIVDGWLADNFCRIERSHRIRPMWLDFEVQFAVEDVLKSEQAKTPWLLA